MEGIEYPWFWIYQNNQVVSRYEFNYSTYLSRKTTTVSYRERSGDIRIARRKLL